MHHDPRHVPHATLRPTAPNGSIPAFVYRQRRLMVVLTAASFLFAGFSIADAAVNRSSPNSAATTFVAKGRSAQIHLVRPGETLWQIARAIRPEGDVRRLVHDLAEANGGAALRAGQTISLPPGPGV